MNACTHRKVTTFVFVDGNDPAGLWACADCGHKFAPVNLPVEKDAERYRWLKYSESLAWPSVDLGNACHRAAREDKDELIDAEIDKQMAAARMGAA